MTKLENIVLSQKNPDTKGHIVYDSIYMKCLGKSNPYRQKVDLVVAKG